MSILICGSLAYDTIMEFDDKFSNHILADQLNILNVSFMVSRMRKEFGGCAGNIAYNLNLLNGDGFIMGTVGKDFAPYAEWMEKWGIRKNYISVISDTYTAQAYITTDKDNNQITIFHPGAMNFSHQNCVEQAGGHMGSPQAKNIRLGIVSPDGKRGMIEHAEQFAQAGIDFIFDPGQGLPMFNKTELIRFLEIAKWVILNDYESKMLSEKTELSISKILERVTAFIVTHGANGSTVNLKDRTISIPSVQPTIVKDPTGCGDAYRAGILLGLSKGWDWDITGRIASLIGTYKIEHAGTQNHYFEVHEFEERFKKNYGIVFRLD